MPKVIYLSYSDCYCETMLLFLVFTFDASNILKCPEVNCEKVDFVPEQKYSNDKRVFTIDNFTMF